MLFDLLNLADDEDGQCYADLILISLSVLFTLRFSCEHKTDSFHQLTNGTCLATAMKSFLHRFSCACHQSSLILIVVRSKSLHG